MPTSLKEFDALHAEQQGSLPVRVLHFLERSNEAHTAEEIASHLLGNTSRCAVVLDERVAELLPHVQEILSELVTHNKIRRATAKGGATGPKVLYAKRLDPA